MSDRPLFENLDEQEATYAPAELPAGSPQARQARVDEGETDNIADEGEPNEGALVPGTAAGLPTGGDVSGSIGTIPGMGGIPAIGPVVSGEAITGNTGVENAEVTIKDVEKDRSA